MCCSRLCAEIANTSQRPLCHVVAASPATYAPPSLRQSDHLPPSHDLCHSPETDAPQPTTNTSTRFGSVDTAAGVAGLQPPRLSHRRHAPPSHHLCHVAPSVPLTNRSTRLGPHDVAAIPVPSVSTPPRYSQSCQ